ncbi:heavy metal translocating P-type ATPase [Parapedobacter lycopersici]|uniref:heavy metal translocating P-type ATPase n=1 Tax=Parapedobacter lycopersici TaxID=1864939 RepID=UPI00214D4725|nr:heavy metal translocating P-type ATPase [Parapedobacter lycopersici]
MAQLDPNQIHIAESHSCCCATDDHHTGDGTAQQPDNQGGGPSAVGAGQSKLQLFMPAIFSFVLLIVGLALDNNWLSKPAFFSGWVRLLWYVIAYAPVALPVIRDMFRAISKNDFFSEFTLMTIATVGAFIIGVYPEGVAVMLFYTVGENIQSLAVRKARGNIRALLDQRPDEVTVIQGEHSHTIKAHAAAVGMIIQLKPGEKLALDGELLSDRAAFDTAALTGESKPGTKTQGDTVLAGMVNLNRVARVRVTAAYTDSKLSRILTLVQHATAQKAPTELFIRKFARWYTPAVAGFAVLITAVPYFFVADYVFSEWLYRALVFLVISCPCALVISIPLGYFGGIGAASRHGLLVKGSNFLDALAHARQVVMDKTGTLTKGVFEVKEMVIDSEFDKTEILKLVNTLEHHSTHPVATAIQRYLGDVERVSGLEKIEEEAGMGLMATVDGQQLLAGNFRLLDKYGISYPTAVAAISDTVIAIAYDGKLVGYFTIADEIKPDAQAAVRELKTMGITPTLLSGDKSAVVQDVARKLGISKAYGDLLPEDKVNMVKAIRDAGDRVIFVGDGLNDAPVLALSDVGIAMGGLGSDAAIETADIVIQDDAPGKIPMGIRIGKATRRIVWQNITLAFSVKIAVLLLGAGGMASMWEAVFADVGVALLAILNAIRIQRMSFGTLDEKE